MGPKPWWARWWWSESTRLDNCPHPSSENFDSLTHSARFHFCKVVGYVPPNEIVIVLLGFFHVTLFLLDVISFARGARRYINYHYHQLVNVVSECNPHAGECIFFYAFLKHLWDWEKKKVVIVDHALIHMHIPFPHFRTCNYAIHQEFKIGLELWVDYYAHSTNNARENMRMPWFSFLFFWFSIIILLWDNLVGFPSHLHALLLIYPMCAIGEGFVPKLFHGKVV